MAFASLAWLSGLIALLCIAGANGVAGADHLKPARRLLQDPTGLEAAFNTLASQLSNCATPSTSCPFPITQITALEYYPACIPGTPIAAPSNINVIVCGYVTGSGFSTDSQNTNLWKEVTAGAGFISFDIVLSGSRYHYAHVAAHCADLVVNVNYASAVSLPACVNPDGLVFIVAGVFNTLGGPTTVALLQVAPQPF